MKVKESPRNSGCEQSTQIFCKRTKNGQIKCSREELNLHGFPHTVLSRTRLPFRHVSEDWDLKGDT